jgi:choline dehydrogenase-like flavoprotein
MSGHLPINGIIPDTPSKKRYHTLTASLLHPFSRGKISSPLSSSSPSSQSGHPQIDPNILSHPIDRALLEGIRVILHLTQTEPFKSAIKAWVLPSELSPDDVERALKSGADNSLLKDLLETHIRNFVRTIYHPIGTAAMMSKEDGGVVDERLRVHGVDGLRVVRLPFNSFE